MLPEYRFVDGAFFGRQMWDEDLAENLAVILVVYFAVGIPLSIYLYHDVIDKRWRTFCEVCAFSFLYGALVRIDLVLLCLYGILQLMAGDYKEGGAAFLSGAVAVYGLFLSMRQACILRFFRNHLKHRADGILSVCNDERMGVQDDATGPCALLFPIGGYKQGPVYGHLSSVFLDDNYPGEGPRVTWLAREAVVKDWTEMVVRTGLWIRLAVSSSSFSFDTALRPPIIPVGTTGTTDVDASGAWTLGIARQQFLESGERKGTRNAPKQEELEHSLNTLIECIEGEEGTLATWRETLRFAPESEWSQALSEFPSAWIDGLEARGVAWEVYLALALPPAGRMGPTESRNCCWASCVKCFPVMCECCRRKRGATNTSESGPPETKDAGEPSDFQQNVEDLICATLGDDGFVTAKVLMGVFSLADMYELASLKRMKQLAEVWHGVAQSMSDDEDPLDKKFTVGVDLVVALAVILDADKRSFEFYQRNAQGMKDALKKRHTYVLERLEKDEAEKILRRSLERYQTRTESASDIAQSRYSLGKFLHDRRQYNEARRMYDRAIQTWEKLQDPQLQDVLVSEADMFMEQGKYRQADSIYLRAIECAEKRHDPKHPVLEQKRADALEKQGAYVEAGLSYPRVLEGLGATVGKKHRDYASALSDQAGLLKAQGNYKEAEGLYEDAIKIWEKALGKNDPQVAIGLSSLAELLKGQGKYDEAKPLLTRALAIIEDAYGPEHYEVATALNNGAGLLKAQGNYELADQLYRRALDIDEKALGLNHHRLTRDLRDWASMLQAQGRYGEAAPLYVRATDIGKRTLGGDHPDVAAGLADWADLLCAQGKFAQAEPLYRQSLDILEKVVGPDHPDVAQALNKWAGLLKTLGKYGEAEPLYQRSLAIDTKVYGHDHQKVAEDLKNLAKLLESQGKTIEAEEHYEESLNIAEKALGTTHPDVATTLNSQAVLFESQGKLEQADSLFQRSLKIRENRLGPKHPRVATLLNNQAELLKKQGMYDKAKPLYERSQAIRENVLGPGHPDVAQSLNNRADLLEKQDNIPEARKLYLKSQALQEKALGPQHPDMAKPLSNRAGLLMRDGKLEKAEDLCRRAIEILEAALGTDHPELAPLLEQLADILRAQGKYKEAQSLYERAIEILEAALGRRHPDVVAALGNLTALQREQDKHDEKARLSEKASATSAPGENQPDTVDTQKAEMLTEEKVGLMG